ncbi:uncharacterized protein [Onthophagus taurus]|uniref:uncharacterized protein n=1 Tax=Onthophagus taurus TaxID=166361 RepID=UPI0039BE7D1D
MVKPNLIVRLFHGLPIISKRQAPQPPSTQAPPPSSTIENQSNLEMEGPSLSSSSSSTPSTKRRRGSTLPPHSITKNKGKACEVCGEFLPSLTSLETHLQTQHAELIDRNVTKMMSCYKNRVVCYKISGAQSDDDIPSYLLKCCETVNRLIEQHLNENGSIKAQIELLANFIKSGFDGDGNEEVITSEKNFNTKFKIITSSTMLNEVYDEMTRDILTQSEEFQECGSGWAFQSISYLLLNLNKFEPIPGSSYIHLPHEIVNKKACINIKNYEDDACLAWCLTAALHPANHSQDRTSSYPHYSQVLNLQGITFPISVRDIVKVEKLNNLSINVYELVKESKGYSVEGPIYFTKQRRDIHINLLYLYESGKAHFVLIKNLSRLISSQVTHHGHSIHICDGCLTRFSSAEHLTAHQINDCNHTKTVVPSTNLKSKPNYFGLYTPQNILEFNNYKFTQMAPFVIYADFESILKPIDHCEPHSSKSFTEKIEMHQPYSFAYYIVSTIDSNFNKFETYTGPDAPQVFISKLIADVKFIYNKYFKTVKPMLPLTVDEQRNFDSAENCFICQNPFTSDQVKVRDHCHISGRYRGPAHTNCNLNFQLQNFIPIFFHNFSGYDCHLFIKEMADADEDGLDVLPNNKEKYISFSKRILVDKAPMKGDRVENVFFKLRFVDSFRFMASSLDSLAGNLDEFDLINIRKFFPHNDQFRLLSKKGIFPYGYMDSLDKLNVTSLPPKNAFFNKLSFEDITDEQYSHAQTVWEKFNCQNLKDYSDLYLKTDVLLLADVFEKFRQVCFKTYDLDPAHYYTAPGLSWDAMLKFTKIKLELLTDIDQVHFIKKGIRGGISQCSLRSAKANNKYMDDYNHNLPSNFLMYWDANNLYGWAMSQFMPVSNFKWLNVDIEYPTALHDLHNDLPFLAENLIAPNNRCESERRLIPNLFDKKNYVIHYRNLKQAVAHGLKVHEINRVLSFRQSAWLKSYIDKNTELRQSAKNAFEKDFFKLMNNSVFGKTMENVDKRVDVRLVTSWDDMHTGKAAGRPRLGARSLIAKLNFKSIKVFTETFSAIQMDRLHVVYDKPL